MPEAVCSFRDTFHWRVPAKGENESLKRVSCSRK